MRIEESCELCCRMFSGLRDVFGRVFRGRFRGYVFWFRFLGVCSIEIYGEGRIIIRDVFLKKVFGRVSGLG